jgi:hypothetical protein
MAGRVSTYIQNTWQGITKDATKKGLHVLSNRFISDERERAYQEYGVVVQRPRTMFFCFVAGIGISIYVSVRWFDYYIFLEYSMKNLFLTRLILTWSSLLFLPCIHYLPKHWKGFTTSFIVLNTVVSIIYYNQKRMVEVALNTNDLSLFYKNWNITDTIISSSSAIDTSLYQSKSFKSSLNLNPTLSSNVLKFAFVSRIFDTTQGYIFPIYALLSGMLCGIGVSWAMIGSFVCEIVYIVCVIISYNQAVGVQINVGRLLVEILIFLVLCCIAYRYDQLQRITISTLNESSRRTNALRSAMIRHISISSMSGIHENDSGGNIGMVLEKRTSEIAVKVQSQLERAIRKLSDLSNTMSNGTERKALEKIANDLSAADVQAYQPDLERELENISDDNLVKKWLLELNPNRNRRSNLNEQNRPSFEKANENFPGKRNNITATSLKNFVDIYFNDNTKNVMRDATQWSVDMFELSIASNGHPLQSVCFTVFVQNDIISEPFNIEANILMKYMAKVESLYIKNPYHNAIHAADVLYGTHYIVNVLGCGNMFSAMEKLAIFFSAAVHDVGHLGVSNTFLIRSNNKLAITYNDSSVLEHMHAATAFEVGHEISFFDFFSTEDYAVFRRTVIDTVLATDLAQHMAFVAQLKSFKNNKKIKFEVEKPLIFMKTIVKLCDLGHSLKKLSIHIKWTERIVEEFFAQGDKEKTLGMPVSPFMDREHPDTPKNQVGFFEFIVLPFWQTSAALVNELDPLLQVGMSNYNYWKDLKQKAKEERSAGSNTKTKSAQELRGILSTHQIAPTDVSSHNKKGVDNEKDEINEEDVGLAIEE